MKPDSAVIYFTVSSGTGYGMIISLLCIFSNIEINIGITVKFIVAFISLFLIISGLFASLVHLGHPERAWRALSQWKSSWLSREGVAAITTFLPVNIFYILWIFTDEIWLSMIALLIASIFCLTTIFCTAKIYSSLKAIPAWHNPLVPIIYILNALVLGSLLNYSILYYFNLKFDLLSNFIVIISITSLFIKLLYWYSTTKKSQSNISTAIGLGKKNNISFFEGPHTGKNYLTSEMINRINNSKSFILRLTSCIFCYITPAFYILQIPYIIIDDTIISFSIIIISFVAVIGMFIERYLFFIDSKHTVSLYYGNKTI